MKDRQPNIILIVMDAVRAQNIACYGYHRNTMPQLEKEILPSAMLYKNAIASSYWTLPSCTSMFTGTYISRHGLVVDGERLSPEFITLADLLKTKGYFTVGLSRNDYISSFSGLDRGFCEFYDYEVLASLIHKIHNRFFKGHKERQVDEDNVPKKLTEPQFNIYNRLFWLVSRYFDKGAKKQNQVVRNIIRNCKDRPFFIYIHYNEAHAPYCPPNPHRNKFLSFEVKKKMWEVNQDQLLFHLGKVVMEQEDFKVLRALYDGSIHYLDQRIYEIYSILENENCLDDTMMIITADHGDNIGEHGLMGHIWCLYDTLIKIPLIIKYPSGYDVVGEDERLVQNLDIMPTIIDILRIQPEKVLSQIQGNSLFSNTIVNRNHNYAIAELLKPFSSSIVKYEEEFMRYNRGLICIRGVDKKYIWSTDGKHELYDLENDPEETNNVIDIETPSLPELQNEVKSRLPEYNQMFLQIKEKIRQPMEIQIDANIKQRLQELGYM